MLILGAVMCGINPVMGMINTAMTDWLNAMGGTSKVLLGAIVAGMMSIDMGGPSTKQLTSSAPAALASGNYEVMAAVMVGGMVPPIAIALSTTFCPKKWTADERRNGIVNYVMGLCFVTEGAIPYAAADPLRVLPSCVAGAAVAGALSMTFGCALRAPHGLRVPSRGPYRSVLRGAGCGQRAGCCDPEPAQEKTVPTQNKRHFLHIRDTS